MASTNDMSAFARGTPQFVRQVSTVITGDGRTVDCIDLCDGRIVAIAYDRVTLCHHLDALFECQNDNIDSYGTFRRIPADIIIPTPRLGRFVDVVLSEHTVDLLVLSTGEVLGIDGSAICLYSNLESVCSADPNCVLASISFGTAPESPCQPISNTDDAPRLEGDMHSIDGATISIGKFAGFRLVTHAALGISDGLVSVFGRKGRWIGNLAASAVDDFVAGDATEFSPDREWRTRWSTQLQALLGLRPESKSPFTDTSVKTCNGYVVIESPSRTLLILIEPGRSVQQTMLDAIRDFRTRAGRLSQRADLIEAALRCQR